MSETPKTVAIFPFDGPLPTYRGVRPESVSIDFANDNTTVELAPSVFGSAERAALIPGTITHEAHISAPTRAELVAELRRAADKLEVEGV